MEIRLIVTVAIAFAIFKLSPATDTPTYDMTLTATPTSPQEVNCSFRFAPGTEYASILSLTVSKSDNPQSKTFTELATVTSYSPNLASVRNSSLGIHASGHLESLGDSFLSLSWPNQPGNSLSDQAGVYMCEAYGLDVFGHPRFIKYVTTNVTASSMGIGQAIARIQELTTSNDICKRKMGDTVWALAICSTNLTVCLSENNSTEADLLKDSAVNNLKNDLDECKTNATRLSQSSSIHIDNLTKCREVAAKTAANNTVMANKLARLAENYTNLAEHNGKLSEQNSALMRNNTQLVGSNNVQANSLQACRDEKSGLTESASKLTEANVHQTNTLNVCQEKVSTLTESNKSNASHLAACRHNVTQLRASVTAGEAKCTQSKVSMLDTLKRIKYVTHNQANDNTYFLSEVTTPKDPEVFSDYCKSLGGFLAVPNNKAEYNFLVDFVTKSVPASQNETKAAMLGIWDDNHDNQWTSMQSPDEHINIGPQQVTHPPHEPRQFCLTLGWGDDLKKLETRPTLCRWHGAKNPIRFLCEVPKTPRW